MPLLDVFSRLHFSLWGSFSSFWCLSWSNLFLGFYHFWFNNLNSCSFWSCWFGWWLRYQSCFLRCSWCFFGFILSFFLSFCYSLGSRISNLGFGFLDFLGLDSIVLDFLFCNLIHDLLVQLRILIINTSAGFFPDTLTNHIVSNIIGLLVPISRKWDWLSWVHLLCNQ